MRLESMATVWASSHKVETQYGMEVGGYTDLRALRANIQSDHNELDLREYGETVSEIVHLRFCEVPNVQRGDMIYMEKPQPIGSFVVDGMAHTDYGEGDYKVEGVCCGYFSGAVRNPTTVDARIVTK